MNSPNRCASIDDFLEQFEKRFGERFQILPFDYRGMSSKMQIICDKHGVMNTTPGSLLRNVDGCPSCSKASSSASNGRQSAKSVHRKYISAEDARSRFTLPDGYVMDMSKYVCWTRGEVSITCPTHGKQTWSSAWRAQQAANFCSKCGDRVNSQKRAMSWETFLERARKVFKDRFTYSDDYGYVNVKSPVSIICDVHGAQKICAVAHLEGQYCAECRRNDMRIQGVLPGLYAEQLPFNPDLASQPGRLYYFQHGTKFKIGITKLPMSKRLKGVPDRAKITRVESVEMTMGEAVAIEQYTLKRFAKFRIARDWSTELFDRDVLANIGHDSLESYVDWFRRNESVDAELQRLRENMESRGFSHIKDE